MHNPTKARAAEVVAARDRVNALVADAAAAEW
jgi:hypothetical protein